VTCLCIHEFPSKSFKEGELAGRGNRLSALDR
jgi:hypothetical protein